MDETRLGSFEGQDRCTLQGRRLLLCAWGFAAFAVITAIAIGIYYPGFASPMMYDSADGIANKSSIFAQHNFLDLMRLIPERPLFMVTLYWNYLLDGMDPFYFRLVNTVILVAGGIALMVVMLLLLESPGLQLPGTTDQKRAVSVVMGLLFILHPLQTYVVLYIWQRMVVMACFFYFSALAAYLAARSGRFGHPTPAYILTSILFLAGMLSKENVATLPIILVFAELILFRQSLREMVSRFITIATIAAVPLLSYYSAIHFLHEKQSVHVEGILSRLLANYDESGLTLSQVGFTQCQVMFSYLRTILAPFVGIEFIRAQTIVDFPWDSLGAAASCAGLIALLLLAIMWWRKKPLPAFGIVFFLVALGPDALLTPQYQFFGYRPILAMPGVFIFLAPAVLSVLVRAKETMSTSAFRLLVVAASTLPLLLFGAMTFVQATRWEPREIWKEAFNELPELTPHIEKKAYADILISYGMILVRSGDFSQGATVLGRAIEIRPNSALAQHSLGESLARLGNVHEAIRLFEKTLELDPRYVYAYNSMGTVMLGMGKLSAAEDYLRKGIEISFDHAELHNNLGATLMKQGKVRQAIESFFNAVKIKPDYAKAHANLGMALVQEGNLSLGIEHLERAIYLNPDLEMARASLRHALGLSEKTQVIKHQEERLR